VSAHSSRRGRSPPAARDRRPLAERFEELRTRAERGPPADPEPFLRALSDPEPLLRCVAVWGLGHLKETRARAAIETALLDPDSRVRALGCGALGALGNRESAFPLRQALADPTGLVRAQAAWALRSIADEHSVEALRPLLTDPDWEVRRAAVAALGRTPTTEAVGALRPSLKDVHERVRREAVLALRGAKDPTVLTDLRPALEDPSGRVRVAAAIVLGEHRDREAVPRLLEHLKERTTFVRPAILIALGRIGDPVAVPALLTHAKEGPSWTRVCALRALAEFGGPEAVEVARQALSDPAWSVRGSAAELLGHAGDRDDLGRLLVGLNDPHPWPRRGVLYALGRLELCEAAPRIREELTHSSAEVRLAAIWTLGRLRDDGAREPLIALLRSIPPNGALAREAPAEERAEGPTLVSDAEERQFDALVQTLGRLAESTNDPSILRALLEARARVREEEWDRPARLPPPEVENAPQVPSLRRLFEVALPGLAEEEGEI
jgi:HEAT repeat protein